MGSIFYELKVLTPQDYLVYIDINHELYFSMYEDRIGKLQQIISVLLLRVTNLESEYEQHLSH